MEELIVKGQKAKRASLILANASSGIKDKALQIAASNLRKHTGEILKANDIDLQNAENNGIKGSLIDRLKLTKERIEGIAAGLEQILTLEDPIGEVISMWKRPNGL
jgi:glutamate-5-semialdehyde dehydrogenase